MSGHSRAVHIAGLEYRYAGRSEATLSDLSLSITPGAWTLLVGRTGSGKSTLLRALCGLIPHHAAGTMQGTVTLFGQDTRHTEPAKLAGLVGLVLQSPDDQVCTTTPAAEIAFGLENLGLPAAEIAARVDASLQESGLAPIAALRTHQLSGGQKQRLVLASILAMRPRLLLLDEPLSQLDPQAAGELLDELDRRRAAGLTIIMVEHRLDEVLPRADRVLVLDRGRLTADVVANDSSQLAAAFEPVSLELPEVTQLALELGWQGMKNVEQMVEKCGMRSAQRGAHSSLCGVSVTSHSPLRTPHSALPTPHSALLAAHRLAHRYPDQPSVWQEVSFELHAGDRVALVGANGSGKSTLLAALAGLYATTEGQVTAFIDGRETSSPPPGWCGLVLQNPDLMLFCRTVFDELAFGPRQASLPENEVRKRVHHVAAQLALEPLLDEPPLALSQGQRLRTALAATLTLRPRLLLLDEPTTGQDQQHLHAIIDALHNLDDSAPRTLVFSTHDLRFATRSANRVLVLGQRSLLADCRPQDLLADDALLAAAHLRRPPLDQLRHHLHLPSRTLAELAHEVRSLALRSER